LMMSCGIYAVGIVVHYVQCGTGHNAGLVSGAPTCPQFIPL
jgi:hypothetical protein